MKKSLLLLISMFSSSSFVGCGGGSSTPTPPIATHFSVTTATSTPTAGTQFNFTVTALDASGNLVSTYDGTVQFTSSDAKAVLPATGALISGTGTFPVTMNTAGPQTITATASSLIGSSPSFMVSASAPAQFSVTTPATATAGAAFSFTVTALDASNNPVSSYSGTVHFTSTDPQASLPANSTLTSGKGTFSATMKTAAPQTITATDTVTASMTGVSSSTAVGPAAATHFTVTASTAATVGIQFNFTVTALDAFANTATTYSGIVHYTTNDTLATVPADAPLASGIGTPSITLKTLGTATITASDTTSPSITGNTPVKVVTNAPTHFAVLTPATATTRASFTITVNILDAANNLSTGYSGTVHFTSSDPQAVLPANSTLTNGTKSFSATMENAGSQTITAADTIAPSLTQPSPAIVVTATTALSITSGAPPAGTFGVIYGPRITQYFRCIYNGNGGFSCTLCSGTTGCYSLPQCTRFRSASPCRETRTSSPGFPLAVTGGIPPYVWSVSGFPPGLGISASSGNEYLSGTPTLPGTYNINVTVMDSGTPQVTTPPSPYTIIINDPAPPVINASPAPPGGAVNLPFTFTFSASSPAPPLVWRLSAGTLPPGLTLTPGGVLSGTPTTAGIYPVTLIATDEFKQDSVPQVFTIQISAHGFKTTGSMAGPRIAHTATLLSNGMVLVAGGTDGSGTAIATAELFNPATGSFTATGPMGTARAHFAATLLCDLSSLPCNDNRVLVTGGLDTNGQPLATAEIYDPSTATFSPTSVSMLFVHASHTATLLKTGQVLIAGWGNAVAELFDPGTGTFKQTGNMATARVGHTATLLNTGKVLVTGGIQGAPPATTTLAEAELYDPGAGSFTATLGSLATARQVHTASLLSDGTVLVTGGLDSNNHALASAEVFNPTTQMFMATKGSMGTARAFHTATVLMDKTVLVTGGDDGNGPLATAEIYDPAAQSFSPTGSMGNTRELHTGILLNDGTVLVTGGTGSGEATAELYH
jgi:Putative Ig domain/Kelch motif/Galactose oxidase, central domain